MAQNNGNGNKPPFEKPTVKSFIIKFLRIIVLFFIAYGLVYGVKFLIGAI